MSLRRGVLLLHGFGGSPGSMQPWADDLAARGYQVSVPLLPGHGTRWQDLADTTWRDWYEAARFALADLKARCDVVAVAGISMGGALALRLAAERPADVRVLLLVNPAVASTNRFMVAVPVLRHVVKSVGNVGTKVNRPGAPAVSYERIPLKAVQSLTGLWRDLRPRLPAVTQPLMLFRSESEGELSSGIVLEGVSSRERREIPLARSGHLATLDYDAETIFTESAAFLQVQLPEPMASPRRSSRSGSR